MIDDLDRLTSQANNLNLQSAELSNHTTSATRQTVTPAHVSSFINSFDLSTPTVPDQVDLRALEYVTAPNENLLCAICASPFVTPMELGCSHIFCKECVYEHLQSGIHSASRCPKCRRPVESLTAVSTLLSQLLDELEVECPNKSLGCTLHVKRYTIKDHVKHYCEFTEIPCPSIECELFIQRQYADQDCLHSYVECEYCNIQTMEKDINYHQAKVCPNGAVECRECHVEVRRINLQTHQMDECHMWTIPCPGHIVGCKFFGARGNMTLHATSCPMAIMAPHIMQQNAKQAQLQQENDCLRDRFADIDSRLEELETICKQLASSIKLERRRSMMPPEGTVSATRLEDLTSRIDDMASDTTSRLDNVTADNARMHMAFINDSVRTGQQFHTMNAALTALRAQVTHLTAMRAAGSSGTTGSTPAGARGGGVALDSARREPPKL